VTQGVIVVALFIYFFLVFDFALLIFKTFEVEGVNQPLRSYLVCGEDALVNVAADAFGATAEVFGGFANCDQF